MFRNEALPLIEEERFAPMYSPDMGRPNRAVQTVLGVLVLKEMFDLTDMEPLEELEFNLLWHHACRCWSARPERWTRPLRWPGGELPQEFGVLRRLLESRMGRRGKREFVQVLRLMENFCNEEVYEGVRDALRLGAISFDAVKHLVLCRIEGRPQRLDLQLYPYLPRVSVQKTSASDYMALMSGSRR